MSLPLPGRREPTPVLRLRYQGSADRRATGICLPSSGQYTESQLPASFGPKTGRSRWQDVWPSRVAGVLKEFSVVQAF
jgi:hypothetical protein